MLNRSEEEWWTPSVVADSLVMHGSRHGENLKVACDLVI